MRIGYFVHGKGIADEFDCVLQAVPESCVAGPIDKFVIVHEQTLGA